MSDVEKIKSYMNESRGRMVELQKKLTPVQALAPENGGDGEAEKAKVLEAYLREVGFENIERFDAPDERVSAKVRPSLVVTIKGETDQNVWLIGHMDVVPTGALSMWNTNPWECVEKDGKLYGRGVEDNQQGLVSSLFGGLYFVENKITPKKTIKFLFVADEECGSEYGVQWLVKNTKIFGKNDLVIIPDGGDSEGVTIEIAEKNLLWLRVHITGLQTHGSRPDTGKNAALASAWLQLALNSLEETFGKKDELFEPPYSTFQPTLHEKNVDGINIIPGDDVFCMDCRILPCYPLNEVMPKIDEKCRECEEKYGVKVSYSIAQKSESPATKETSEVVKMLSNAIAAAHGQKTKCIGIGGGTVGGELRREGIDCAVWSTLDEMAHQPNEYCIIDNMIKDAVTIAAMFV